jgi:hypothetical protein
LRKRVANVCSPELIDSRFQIIFSQDLSAFKQSTLTRFFDVDPRRHEDNIEEAAASVPTPVATVEVPQKQIETTHISHEQAPNMTTDFQAWLQVYSFFVIVKSISYMYRTV